MSYCHRLKKSSGDRRTNKPCETAEIKDLYYKRRELRHDKNISLDCRPISRKRTGRLGRRCKRSKRNG
ncbi:hypothetical protein DPMN_083526 [Dreissena polymorpha]|uniref:Uncharacterized protein n=1 Tax=Dreissena polymorpha TaxID=45954 RepID=A0A9D3Y921_DREPO|nr:hypothetical protein DPMN_083526 [Dreissena polymorpha]